MILKRRMFSRKLRHNCSCMWQSIESSITMLSDLFSKLILFINLVIYKGDRLNKSTNKTFEKFKTTSPSILTSQTELDWDSTDYSTDDVINDSSQSL